MQRMERSAGIRFIRRMLDAALVDAPDDVYGNPIRYFDNGRTLPLSLRLVWAMRGAGWVMVSSNAGYRKVEGIRRRLELEDLLNMTFIAIGAALMRQMQLNDQARDRVATHLWESLHEKRVVLRRVAR